MTGHRSIQWGSSGPGVSDVRPAALQSGSLPCRATTARSRAGIRGSERYPNRIFASDGAYADGDFGYVDFDAFSTDDITPGTYN